MLSDRLPLAPLDAARLVLAYMRSAAFVEEQHPRDEKGQFAIVEHSGAETSGAWPVSDTAERTLTDLAKMEQATKVWQASLSPTERSTLEKYTSEKNTSKLMNNGLRFPQYADDWTAKTAADLGSILEKAPTPPPPELVWRGIHGKDAEALAASLKPGDVIQLQGFQSTSLDPYLAYEYNHKLNTGGQRQEGALFEIKPARGGFMRPFSDFKTEQEFLLPHAQHYVVRGTKEVAINGPFRVKQRVVQLEMQ